MTYRTTAPGVVTDENGRHYCEVENEVDPVDGSTLRLLVDTETHRCFVSVSPSHS